MAKLISLRDANQKFAKLVREVESGQAYLVTRRGKPVAQLGPVPGKARQLTPQQEAALEEMFDKRRMGLSSKGWRFNRDELYDEVTGVPSGQAKPINKKRASSKRARRG
jgi:prevent-host-death family protein